MSTSLTDLFEVQEGFDPKEEMIASILMHTSDEDNNSADEPFMELAKRLESDEISLEDAQASLESMTHTNEEVVTEEHDHEGRMAKHDLLKLTQYSAKLYKALEDNEQLPAWIQSKITLAADYIGTVKHYLEGEEVMDGEEAPEEPIQEAAGDIEYYNWEDLHLDIFTNKPAEEISDRVMLPLATDGRLQLNLGNYKRALGLADDYVFKPGTEHEASKEDIVKRELGYVEKSFNNWKTSFDLEGDEEVVVHCTHTDCIVKIEAIQKMSDKYSAGKAKGDTKDIYESSLLNILSK